MSYHLIPCPPAVWGLDLTSVVLLGKWEETPFVLHSKVVLSGSVFPEEEEIFQETVDYVRWLVRRAFRPTIGRPSCLMTSYSSVRPH